MESDHNSDEEPEALSKPILDYYKRFSQSKQLPKYFSGASVSYLPEIHVELSQVVEEGSVELLEEQAKSDTEDVVEPKTLSPASSVTSNRKLEWDNGADIGYSNLHKSLSAPILIPVTVGKEPKLSREIVAVTSVSSDSSEKKIQSSSSSPSLKTASLEPSTSTSSYGNSLTYLKSKIGTPDAESTPKINLGVKSSAVKLCVTKPILVECLNEKLGCDKNVQTSIPSDLSSKSIQTSSIKSDEPPPIGGNQSVVTINHDSDVQTSQTASSFEYKKNSDIETPILGQLISSKQSETLKEDIDRSIEILQKLIKSKKYDPATKKRYIKRIVRKIVDNKYTEDTSSSSGAPQQVLQENRPWCPPQLSKFTVKTFSDEFLPGKLFEKESSSDQVSSERQDSSSYQSWKENKTLSERILERQMEHEPCGDGDHLVRFAMKERQNQLSWISDEIKHLTKLKGLLERDRLSGVHKTTTVYMLRQKYDSSYTSSSSNSGPTRNYVIETQLASRHNGSSRVDLNFDDHRRLVGDIHVVSDERTTNIKVNATKVNEEAVGRQPILVGEGKYDTFPKSRQEMKDKCWPCGMSKDNGVQRRDHFSVEVPLFGTKSSLTRRVNELLSQYTGCKCCAGRSCVEGCDCCHRQPKDVACLPGCACCAKSKTGACAKDCTCCKHKKACDDKNERRTEHLRFDSRCVTEKREKKEFHCGSPCCIEQGFCSCTSGSGASARSRGSSSKGGQKSNGRFASSTFGQKVSGKYEGSGSSAKSTDKSGKRDDQKSNGRFSPRSFNEKTAGSKCAEQPKGSMEGSRKVNQHLDQNAAESKDERGLLKGSMERFKKALRGFSQPLDQNAAGSKDERDVLKSPMERFHKGSNAVDQPFDKNDAGSKGSMERSQRGVNNQPPQITAMGWGPGEIPRKSFDSVINPQLTSRGNNFEPTFENIRTSTKRGSVDLSVDTQSIRSGGQQPHCVKFCECRGPCECSTRTKIDSRRSATCQCGKTGVCGCTQTSKTLTVDERIQAQARLTDRKAGQSDDERVNAKSRSHSPVVSYLNTQCKNFTSKQICTSIEQRLKPTSCRCKPIVEDGSCQCANLEACTCSIQTSRQFCPMKHKSAQLEINNINRSCQCSRPGFCTCNTQTKNSKSACLDINNVNKSCQCCRQDICTCDTQTNLQTATCTQCNPSYTCRDEMSQAENCICVDSRAQTENCNPPSSCSDLAARSTGPTHQPIERLTSSSSSCSDSDYSTSYSSNESLHSCRCCKRKNVTEKNLYALGRKLSEQTHPLCRPCYRQHRAGAFSPTWYSNPTHICNCYTVIQTNTVNQIKRTINELTDLDEQYCTCDTARGKRDSGYCKHCRCKLKRGPKSGRSVAYMLTFEDGTPVKQKKRKKKRPLEEIKIKIPVPFKKNHKRNRRGKESGASNSSLGCRPKNCKGRRRRESGGSNLSWESSPTTSGKRAHCSVYNVQEYLAKNRPDFVDAAEHRRKTVIASRIIREEMSDEKKLKFLQDFCQDQCEKYAQRLFSEKEMKEITRRNYQKLPEVQQKLIDKRQKQIRQADKLMAETFNRKLRENVLRGKRNLSTDVNVINL